MGGGAAGRQGVVAAAGSRRERHEQAQAVSALQKNEWKKADVVFVSDGQWPAPSALVAMVAQAKAGGTRLHGVQIGNRGRTGLHAVCAPVHEFTEWAALANWR